MVDPVLVSSALDAVLDNAVKFTPDGAISLGAHLTADRTQVEIAVRDTGIGLQSADIAQLVEDIVPGPPRTRGLGLGLRMAKRLAEFLSGSLRARSHEGRGTHFTIAIPVVSPEQRPPKVPHA